LATHAYTGTSVRTRLSHLARSDQNSAFALRPRRLWELPPRSQPDRSRTPQRAREHEANQTHHAPCRVSPRAAGPNLLISRWEAHSRSRRRLSRVMRSWVADTPAPHASPATEN